MVNYSLNQLALFSNWAQRVLYNTSPDRRWIGLSYTVVSFDLSKSYFRLSKYQFSKHLVYLYTQYIHSIYSVLTNTQYSRCELPS
jgi:hypothetical protein